MSKIILTQAQLKEITKRLAEEQLQTSEIAQNELEEGADDDDTYTTECDVDFDYHGTNFKGHEINDITGYKIRLSYRIDVEARSWGIKNIILHGISGPSDYEMEVDYYPDSDDSETETVNINLNWDEVEQDEESGQGVISVGQTITIHLGNDNEGNIICTGITVPVYTL